MKYIDFKCGEIRYWQILWTESVSGEEKLGATPTTTKITSLITPPKQINHTGSCLPDPSPHPIRVPVLCTKTLRDTGDGKQDTFQKLRQRDKVPNTNDNPASTLTNGHQEVELLSFPLHRRTTIHSQRISLSFWPASWERGRKCGRFWSSALCVCEYLLISHQWGKLQHLFLFLLAHDTQPVFFGSDSPQSLAAKFFGRMLNVVTQWLPSFQHEQIQIIVFINSCRGDAPTQADSKNGHV